MTDGHWSRRRLLVGGGAVGLAGMAATGAAGYAWSDSQAAPDAPASPAVETGDVQVFASRSDLRPPRLTVGRSGSVPGLPEYILLGNKAYEGKPLGQGGLMIADLTGEIVWFSPGPVSEGQFFDLNVQTYKGKPVLTWWHGQTSSSHGVGTCYIADSSYKQIATVNAGNGLRADMHEFNLTDQGTALIDAYRTHTTDLRPVGGTANGVVESGVVQEIDIATGDVVFEWDSLDHVPVTQTHEPFYGGTSDAPFSYFHINSVSVAPDGDLLVSSRHTWAIYKIGRHDGKIRWQLGGKNSDFTLGPGVEFYWQHHVRAHGPDLLTVFDNGAGPAEEPQSRGLLLRLDTQRMHATLVRAFTSPARLLAGSQGSMQLLPGGGAFVGWGSQPYFSAFGADGSMLLNGYLPAGDMSYRAFVADWTGHPRERPAIAVRGNPPGGTAVYASWNGATEATTWRVLAGKLPSSLDPVAAMPRCGFETMIVANSEGPYFAVTAHDSAGTTLGQSETVRLT
ncbi:MAG: arylsulfotransferase family protein [Nocardiopsaceae bacterium]|nr:arylsulfotransferase family protein [Nocardiopsaceae bacterium]